MKTIISLLFLFLVTFTMKAQCPSAGKDTTVCGLNIQLNASLNIGDYNYHWITPLGVSINNIYSLTANATASIPGQYILIWEVTNNLGDLCKDTINVTFLQIPIANAGDDTSFCGNLANLAVKDSTYPGWWSANPSSALYNSSYEDFSPTVWIPNFSTTTHNVTFTWHAYNGQCKSSDNVIITFIKVPHAEAGPDQSVCGTSTALMADTIGSGIVSAMWWCIYSLPPSPSVTITNAPLGEVPSEPIIDIETWMFGVKDQVTVMFFWVATSQYRGQACKSMDTVKVTFYKIPVPIAGIDTVVCGKLYDMQGKWSLDNNKSGIWSTILPSPGTANFVPANTPDCEVTINQYGEYYFIWKEMNKGRAICEDRDTIKINFKPKIINGLAQSSLVNDFSTFKAELFPEISYENTPYSNGLFTINGNFSLWAEPNKNYYLKVSATNPFIFPTLANTYYNNSYSWENATLLTTTGNCDTINVTVPLVNMIPSTGGQCRIFGWIRYDVSLAPVYNAMTYLRYQPNQDIARFEFTNQNGYYSINNIATGNYELFVDIPGIPQVTNHNIVVNSNDTVFANVNFIVDTTSISKQYGFGIYADTTGYIHVSMNDFSSYSINAFPNPFSEYISINGKLNNHKNISVELIDNSGQTIKNYPNNNFTPGEFAFSLPVPTIAKGIYYLQITIDKTVYIKKLTRL